MKQGQITAICLLLFLLPSCRTGKDVPSPSVEVKVIVNEVGIPGIEVLLLDKSCRTNDDGICQFVLNKPPLNKDARIAVRYKPLKIDTSFVLPLRPQMLIALSHTNSNETAILNLISKRDSLDNLQEDLDLVGRVLEKIKENLERFLKEHPNSGMDKFRTLISLREDEHAVLLERIRKLKTEYATVIDKMESGKIPEENWNEMDDIFKATRAIVREFKNKIYDTSEIISKNRDSRKELEFSTDIFFNSGKYKIEQLTFQQSEQLSKFKNNVNQFIATNFPGEHSKTIIVYIKVVGSADGQNVGETLWNEIYTQCPSGLRSNDRNLCLSELRAISLEKYLRQMFEALYPEIETKGIGNINAPQGVSISTYRKGSISCVIYPLKQSQGRSTEYRLNKKK